MFVFKKEKLSTTYSLNTNKVHQICKFVDTETQPKLNHIFYNFYIYSQWNIYNHNYTIFYRTCCHGNITNIKTYFVGLYHSWTMKKMNMKVMRIPLCL